MAKIFVDSNYFIALYRVSDSLHTEAIKIAGILNKEGVVLVVSNFVFAEIVTVLSQREGKELARMVGETILTNRQVEHIHIDQALHKKSWEIFHELSEKDISFVDCSIIAVMREYDIKELLTFDLKDFKKFQKKYRFRLYSGV